MARGTRLRTGRAGGGAEDGERGGGGLVHHAPASVTPADSKVAISRSTRRAASARPIARTAPVPSPSRRSRSSSGRSPGAPGPPGAPARRSGARPRGSRGRGTESDGRQRRRAGDEPSRRTGTRRAARPQQDARQAGDLEAAHLGQHVERVGRVGPVDPQRPLDRAHLEPQPAVVDAGAAAVTRPAGARQDGRDGAGGRGVADAHVAHAEQPGRPPRPTRRPGRCRLPGADSSRAAHGGAAREVGRPRPRRQSRTCGKSTGHFVPRSATTTRAPCCRARTLMAAPPVRKFFTICAVTSCG